MYPGDMKPSSSKVQGKHYSNWPVDVSYLGYCFSMIVILILLR